MILVNTDYITGKELKMLGIVKGTTVRAKHLGTDIVGGLKNLVCGEITGNMEMFTKRMGKEAEEMGADAVVNIRYGSSALMQGAAEIVAYGTAVKFEE